MLEIYVHLLSFFTCLYFDAKDSNSTIFCQAKNRKALKNPFEELNGR